MTLHERIQQLVNLGYEDPLKIAQTILSQDDERWVGAQLLSLSEDLLADLARSEIGRVRRSKIIAIRPGVPMTSAEAKTAVTWIPGVGFMKVARVTREQAAKTAEAYRKAGVALFRRSAWWSEVLGMMKGEGVETVGKLKAELPPLPDEDDLALPAAAEA